MIVNPSGGDYYKSKVKIMEYLVYKCGIPILSFDKNFYYFARTDKLYECLDKMPLMLKIKSLFTDT